MSKYISIKQKSVLSTERGIFCVDCGKLHNGQTEVINDNDALISVCDCCIEHNGYEFCKECKRYAVTAHDVYTGRRMTRTVCQKCIDESDNIKECEDCAEYFYNSKCGVSGRDYAFCEVCSENYGHCDACGNIEHYDNLYYHENSDRSYCASCLPAEEEEEEELHDYSYDPPHFNFYGDTRDGPHIGVELEIDDGHDGVKILTGYPEHYSNYYLKKDGSLSSKGIEIVTHPHTYPEMINLPWEGMFSELAKSGYRSHDGDKCGLHFHVDREWLYLTAT